MGDDTPDSDLESESDVALATRVRRPRRHAAVLHNDDYTTFEFVVEVLTRFFSKSPEEAAAITVQVHQQGKGVAGVFSYEIAETKCAQAMELARARGFPLKATTEVVT